MIACSPIRTCARYVPLPGWSRRGVMPQLPSGTCCFHLALGCGKPNNVATSNSCQSLIGPDVAKRRSNWQLLAVKSVVSRRGPQKTSINISLGSHNMKLRLLFPKQGIISRMKWSLTPMSWMQGCASAGLVLGLSVCSSTSEPAYAEAKLSKKDSSTAHLSHGKQVYTDYSVIGIPGDGRCLFRAVAHGACIRSGKPAPSESLQRELADELRANVADEFVKRREETEWFIEGDFDTYVSQIRKTHVWGGEPELLMASHVLKLPITVYINDQDSGGLISIAEYGQEYSKEDPVRVLYHGFGHYDALHIPATKDSRSRL